MGINRAPIKFLTFGFLAPPNHDTQINTVMETYQGMKLALQKAQT